jgi:hypothetical protein
VRSVRKQCGGVHFEVIGELVEHGQRDVLLAGLKPAQVGAVQPYSLRNVGLGLTAFLAQGTQPCADLCQAPRINVHMATINDRMQTIVIIMCSRLGGSAGSAQISFYLALTMRTRDEL